MEEDDDTTKVLPEWVGLEYRVRMWFLLAPNETYQRCFFFLLANAYFGWKQCYCSLHSSLWHL